MKKKRAKQTIDIQNANDLVGSGENSGKERELEVVRVQTTKNERKKKDSIRKTDQSPEITILKKNDKNEVKQ